MISRFLLCLLACSYWRVSENKNNPFYWQKVRIQYAFVISKSVNWKRWPDYNIKTIPFCQPIQEFLSPLLAPQYQLLILYLQVPRLVYQAATVFSSFYSTAFFPKMYNLTGWKVYFFINQVTIGTTISMLRQTRITRRIHSANTILLNYLCVHTTF